MTACNENRDRRDRRFSRLFQTTRHNVTIRMWQRSNRKTVSYCSVSVDRLLDISALNKAIYEEPCSRTRLCPSMEPFSEWRQYRNDPETGFGTINVQLNDHTDCGIGGRRVFAKSKAHRNALRLKTILRLPRLGAIEERGFFTRWQRPVPKNHTVMPSKNSSVGIVPNRVWPSTELSYFAIGSSSNRRTSHPPPSTCDWPLSGGSLMKLPTRAF